MTHRKENASHDPEPKLDPGTEAAVEAAKKQHPQADILEACACEDGSVEIRLSQKHDGGKVKTFTVKVDTTGAVSDVPADEGPPRADKHKGHGQKKH